MAGTAVKGFTKLSSAIATGHQIGDSMKSVPDIHKKKASALNSLGLFYGFVPINPVTWPAQMPLLLILVLIFAFYFQFSWTTSFLAAYVIQALVTAYIYSKITSGLSSIFFGV